MKCCHFKYLLFSLIILSITLISCGKKTGEEDKVNMEEVQKMEQEFKEFAENLEAEVARSYTDMGLTYWVAANSGKAEDFDKATEAEIKLDKIFSNKVTFEKLKAYRESGLILDDILKRNLELMYLSYLGKQIDPNKLAEMTKLQTEIAKKFQNYRANVDGKDLTDNDVEKTLKTSKDSKVLEKVWKAHKSIGPIVADDIIKLVKMRNEAAKELGFSNYHEMSLKLNEQDPADISNIFDELDELTGDSFKALKNEMDEVIAKQCGITRDELMPWHYQNRYFQEAPQIYDIDLDTYYKGKDIVQLTKDYYTSIGLPIDKMVEKSDLFERKGKNQHAFCIDIDRDKKDVRVLCNVKDNSGWMNTMLHEYGHAVYFKWHDKDLPWFLKSPAQIFTTEAIAMLFGRFASNAQWMQDMLKISDEEKEKISETANKILTLEQLVFSRWSQVMYRFEKSLYENPDQDLNKLWWTLVEKYQMVKVPEGRNEPDWASKTHIATSPCYYHNYHLGELLASQLYYYMCSDLLNVPEDKVCTFYNQPKAGEYLIDKVFAPGAKYEWNDMIEKATGEKLTAKYYAKQFVKK
ncbi:M3 family metallopeptidase [Bacteroidota bacterium]